MLSCCLRFKNMTRCLPLEGRILLRGSSKHWRRNAIRSSFFLLCPAGFGYFRKNKAAICKPCIWCERSSKKPSDVGLNDLGHQIRTGWYDAGWSLCRLVGLRPEISSEWDFIGCNHKVKGWKWTMFNEVEVYLTLLSGHYICYKVA